MTKKAYLKELLEREIPVFHNKKLSHYSAQSKYNTYKEKVCNPTESAYIFVEEEMESSNCGERGKFEITHVNKERRKVIAEYYWDTFKCSSRDCRSCRYSDVEEDEEGYSYVIGCSFDKAKMRKEIEEYKSILNLE